VLNLSGLGASVAAKKYITQNFYLIILHICLDSVAAKEIFC
jgi:hypothetical protein